jgi:D-aminopeptidase
MCGMLSRVPRAADLPIRIGLYPSGPTSSVLDVPGVGLGHSTVWRDGDPPPTGRGVARTGVTVLDVGGNLFRSPVPAGGAVLNGAGECTGFLSMQEWGLAETPVFLTSTMQVGRVFDAACELLVEEDPSIGVEDVAIPLVAECDDSHLNDSRRTQVSVDDVRAALAAARASAGSSSPPEEGAVGAGTGMTCLGYKGGIGTASRLLPTSHTVGAMVLTNFGEQDRLTVAGVPVGQQLSRAGSTRSGEAGSCIVVLVTDAPLDPVGCQRLARRAGLGLARTGSTAYHASGEIFLALATGLRTTRGAAAPGVPLAGRDLDPFLAAAVEATEEAVVTSLLAATTVVGRDGNRAEALPFDDVVRLLRDARAG